MERKCKCGILYRRSMQAYIRTLIMALETEFHSERMAKSDKARFMSQAAEISNKYEIDNFIADRGLQHLV